MRLTPNRLAAGILVYFVLLALTYASVTPIFEAPDESSHFFYIHNLINRRELPVILSRAAMRDPATPIETRLSVQIHHPPLYYLIGAVLVSWTKRDDALDYAPLNPLAAVGTVSVNNLNANMHLPGSPHGDTALAVYILRLYSIALGAGTLWWVYLTGRLAFPQPSVGLLAMVIVASIPNFIYISASISNDNMVTFVYSAGVYWCLRLWQRRMITRSDVGVISLILPAVALSKVTGASLFALVYGVALIGAWRGRFRWRQVGLLIGVSLVSAVVLAGWWYLRNLSLYGDPLGLRATLALWSRGLPLSKVSDFLFEGKGAWESFWMVLGHFNIRGPDWLFTYAPAITIGGFIGCILIFWREPSQRWIVMFLAAVCLLAVAMMVIATRQVNVSQGRILFPALAGFAPLIAAGLLVLLRRWSGALALPLAALALSVPALYLAPSFAGLMVVDAPPADARRLDARSESLNFLAYQLRDTEVEPGGVVRLWLYISGQHPENPVLYVKALDPVTQQPLGSIDVFPGMAPTSALEPDKIYRVPIAFALKPESTRGIGPYHLDLQFGWRVMETDRFLPFTDAAGHKIKGLVAPGPVLIDRSLQPPAPTHPADVTFGEAMRLTGYDLTSEQPAPGGTLDVRLHWRYLKHLDGEWVVAFGLLDAQNQVIAQADGAPAGYPVSAWLPGPDFADQRKLTIPASTPPGRARIYIAVYQPGDGVRLPAVGEHVEGGNMFLVPQTITVGQ